MKKFILILLIMLLVTSCSPEKLMETVKNYVPVEKLSIFSEIKDLIGELDEVKDVNLDGKEVDFSFKLLGKDVKVIRPYVVIDNKIYGGEAAYKIYDLLKAQISGSKFVLIPEDLMASKIVLTSGSKNIEVKKNKSKFIDFFGDSEIIKKPVTKKNEVATYFTITDKANKLIFAVSPNGKTFTLYDEDDNYTVYSSTKINIVDFVNKVIAEEK